LKESSDAFARRRYKYTNSANNVFCYAKCSVDASYFCCFLSFYIIYFLSLFDDESQSVVRVVRISIENGTFGGAAAEKPVNRLTQNLALVIIYVGDATQYPKWHVNRFEELPPRRDEMLMVSAFYFVCALLQLGVNRWTDFDE